MMLASLLHSGLFGANRTYFLHFRTESSIEYHDGLVGNSVAVAIEITVLLGLKVWLQCMFGINLWEFMGTCVRLDFSFYVFAMSCCFIAWIAIMLSHFGTWDLLSWLNA
ncbi:unnamed protein product [Symbiodinium necroappetens]|uniref:Uncharacterized protein n=1 Tax=Symbiodinium necroappetens TaxID=1628268 RepID=A0A812KMD2_9DINO|nr:unnamed protein product [Symbiodinium necroappetens]